MKWLVLQFVFLALPVILPMALYRNRCPFMAAFYRAMTGNVKARKLYTQVLVVLLLLFHYVYTTGHPGQFGTVLSATVCAAMFSARRTDRWLRKLNGRRKAMVIFGGTAFGYMCRAAVVHPVCHHLIPPSGSVVLSLRQDPDRMGGQGQEALPVGASG